MIGSVHPVVGQVIQQKEGHPGPPLPAHDVPQRAQVSENKNHEKENHLRCNINKDHKNHHPQRCFGIFRIKQFRSVQSAVPILQCQRNQKHRCKPVNQIVLLKLYPELTHLQSLCVHGLLEPRNPMLIGGFEIELVPPLRTACRSKAQSLTLPQTRSAHPEST